MPLKQLLLLIKKIFNFFKTNLLLVIILVIGFIYRFYGIYFDFPAGINAIWDETVNMVYIFDLLSYKTLLVSSGPYSAFMPMLYFPAVVLKLVYLMAVNHLPSVDSLVNFLTLNGMGHILVVLRWYSVFFGVASIYLIYLISNFLFKNKISGYFSAAAYAASLVPVVMAHWAKVHVPMVFFLLLALYFVLKFEEKKDNKLLYLSSLFSGLAVCVHWIGISAFIFPFLAIIFNWRDINKKVILKTFFIALISVLIFYLINIVGVSKMFFRDMGRISDNGFGGMFPVGIRERFTFVFFRSFMVEPVFISLLAVIILIKAKKLWQNVYIRYVLSGLAFNYLLMSTIFAAPSLIRYLLAFITLAIILSSGLIASYLTSAKLNKFFIAAIFIFLLLPGAYFSYRFDRILNHHTSRDAVNWLEENLKPDEIAYSFDLYIDAPLSYEAVKFQVDQNKLGNSKKYNYIIKHKEKYINHGVNLFYDIGNNRFKDLGGTGTRYVIISYWEAGSKNKEEMVTSRKMAYEILDKIRAFHKLEPATAFYPTDNKQLIAVGVMDYMNNPLNLLPLAYLEKSGPTTEIYKIVN